jgi:hypothetical protein
VTSVSAPLPRFPRNAFDGDERNSLVNLSFENAVVPVIGAGSSTGLATSSSFAVLWLCGPRSSFAFGYALAVDGGFTAH